MRSPFSHFWICIAACAALVACETPDDDPSPPDVDVPDASIGAGGMGGEGGEGGMGGEGGVGGEGGMGGTGGVPEGDCAEIEDEAGCEARDDCAPRRDAVEGAFVDCRPLGDVPCSMLSGADCDRRDDCEMDGELCSPLPVECADHPDARTCASAGCHWWDDGCHDDPRPMPCDQPDPESCTNAGCMWGEDGCRPRPPACESLDRQVACDAREDCRWNNNRCEIDPGERTCEELDAMQCAEREDCGWSDEGCGPMPEGACGDLDYVECDMRPDCESNGCNCPPDVECDCENLCWPREFDCADVPIDACDRTPGCMVEEVCGEGGDGNAFAPGEDPAEPDPGRPAPPACEERCVVDEADRCAQLDERACIADPDCHVEYVVDCGGMGDADGDGAPDRVPCFEQAVCVEGGEDRVICAEIEDPRICAATDGCQLANECNCDELPPPDPADCGCEDGEPCPCLIAVPPCDCPICEDADGPPPGDCEGRDFEACVDDPSCEWIWAAEDLPAEGGGCMCWQDENGREICECVGIAPPAPDEGWCVDGDPPPPNMCEEIANPERCEATDGCQWVAVACGNCVVDDAGNEICPDCDDDGMGGFCTPDRVMPQGCEEHFDPDRCEADPNCAWEAFDCECFVGMDGEEICPPCPAPGGFCAWREVDPCERFDEAMCMDVDGCEWIPDGDDPGEPVEPVDPDEPMDDGRDNPAEPPADEAARPAPCPCEPGPDGEMICDCDPIEPPPPPLGGRCVTAPPAGDQCWAYGPDECEADPECGLLDNFGMGMPVDCPPCEPGEACPPCDALIAPALMCMPLEFYCASLPVEQCDPNRCAVEEREVCWGGGGPACPPGEACMDVPPPPDGGECFVERVCVSP